MATGLRADVHNRRQREVGCQRAKELPAPYVNYVDMLVFSLSSGVMYVYERYVLEVVDFHSVHFFVFLCCGRKSTATSVVAIIV